MAARLWAKTVTFESINPGDQLPILVKWETRDTIARFAALLSPDNSAVPLADAAADREESANNLPAAEPALIAYVTELLEKAFPVTSLLAQGSELELHSLLPVRAEDTITLSGEVTGKREEDGRRLVDTQVVIENQAGQVVATATARVSL